MNFNYQKVSQTLLSGLPKRTQKVIVRRFGLETKRGETLESIGKSYGITRERVRQIEKDGLLKIRPEIKKYHNVVQFFSDQLKITGDLRKEDILLNLFGGEDFQNHVYFLLTLEDQFNRFSETQDLHSLWSINPESLDFAQKIIDSFHKKLTKTRRPLALKDYKLEQKWEVSLTSPALLSYLEISKKIQQGPESLFGLKDWPEINPRGVKDKAYLVLKKEKKPLHFTEVTKLIDALPLPLYQRRDKTSSFALPQTVHNELIRDPRFVLVGRGLYALREWGYTPGTVLDVISKVLKESKKPLTKKEILEKVLKQRLVKKNTILLNLSNKKYFLKNSEGKYQLKEA